VSVRSFGRAWGRGSQHPFHSLRAKGDTETRHHGFSDSAVLHSLTPHNQHAMRGVQGRCRHTDAACSCRSKAPPGRLPGESEEAEELGPLSFPWTPSLLLTCRWYAMRCAQRWCWRPPAESEEAESLGTDSAPLQSLPGVNVIVHTCILSHHQHASRRAQGRCRRLPAESEEAEELGRQAADLALGLRDVSELYNDYAQPHKVRACVCVWCARACVRVCAHACVCVCACACARGAHVHECCAGVWVQPHTVCGRMCRTCCCAVP